MQPCGNFYFDAEKLEFFSKIKNTHPKVLTYDFIIREIWGPNAVGDTQNLRANMAKIRRKLEKNPAKPQYIFTEVGVGYRMAEGD